MLKQMNKKIRQNNPDVPFEFRLSKILNQFRSFVLPTSVLYLAISVFRVILCKIGGEAS